MYQPLTDLNTFRVASRAARILSVDSKATLVEFLNSSPCSASDCLVIGSGSNVLFVGDYPGTVLHNTLSGIEVRPDSTDSVELSVGAGENWHHFVMHCLANGFHGLENLALIPGSVGAAPVQNIGAYGAEVGEFIQRVEAVDLETAETVTFDRDQCQFGYRSSYFKQAAGKRYFITRVVFRMSRHFNPVLSYRGLDTLAAAYSAGELTAQQLCEQVIALRQDKLPDPSLIPNAGSFFKNPVLSEREYKQWLQVPGRAECPNYASDSGVKLSAAWLLEQAGWKGVRRGDAGIYDKHALVLVNHGQATGEQIWGLAQEMIQSVSEGYAINLQPEVRIITGAPCSDFADT